MIKLIKSSVILLFMIQFNKCTCFVWDNMPCSSDPKQNMPEGIQDNVGRFPWIGVVQHSFYIAEKQAFAITGAVLVHRAYAIAAAEDMAKIIPDMLMNNTKLILWKGVDQKYGIDVKDYVLHPEYHKGITTATLALLYLIAPETAAFSEFHAPVRPVCMPLTGAGTLSEIYAVKLTDATGELQKEVWKMTHVNRRDCEEFYYQAQLHYEKLNPTNPLCAVSVNSTIPCVWDSGVVLITRQSWGFWQMIGFAARGPGCGAPTKFLKIHDYLPWINDIIASASAEDADDEFFKIGVRRQSNVKLIMYPTWVDHPLGTGRCDRDERGGVLYRESSEMLVNKDYVQGFYFLTISQVASFHCIEVRMEVSKRSNAAMWVEHNCHRDTEGAAIGQPRSGDVRKTECFIYFKTTAFIEIRFFYSFSAVMSLAVYGKAEYPKVITNPFKRTQATTAWWPTSDGGKLRWWQFVPQYLRYYQLK